MELLERVGLPARSPSAIPAQLSGGQQQRVGVARALAADPPVMLMDEPFSAVDPVVREQLQNEFLRLQGELGKTIVFVTHDIDEAIKLGDQVAVHARRAASSPSSRAPAELLARPADAFVAGFVGRDRGYRALGFAQAGALPLSDEAPVRLGEPLRAARDDARDGWVLVVDANDVPQGWLAVGRLPDTRSPARSPPTCSTSAARWPASRARCARRSTPPCPRRAGAASSSTTTARFAGTVSATQVLGRIEERAASARSEAVDAAADELRSRPPVAEGRTDGRDRARDGGQLRPRGTSGVTSSTTAARTSASSGRTSSCPCCPSSSG